MPDSFLLRRILLTFDQQAEEIVSDLSAIAKTPDGSLWAASDEPQTIERLKPLEVGHYGAHQSFHLGDFLELADADSEIDIEGIDYSEGYLWIVGSHSLKRKKPKGKKVEKDLRRLAKIERETNRYLLARIPLSDGEPVKTLMPSANAEEQLSAAALPFTDIGNPLMEALARDDFLGPFIQAQIPSKDNGFDIEGIAVRDQRVLLGLRGPVLRGWATILELELALVAPGCLQLKPLEEQHLYRKHFLNLNGLGVRELCCQGNDLIILAGPTMELDGTQQVFRLKDVWDSGKEQLWHQDNGKLRWLFDLPMASRADRAEGLTLVSCLGSEQGLMVAYDAPADSRRPSSQSVFVDVFQLPD